MRLVLMLTNQCNLACAHCITSSTMKDCSRLSLDHMLRLIDEAHQISKSQKKFSVCFVGGEPFLYFDDLAALVEYASKKGAIVSTMTNGFWAKTQDEAYHKVAQLKKAGLKTLGLSCDNQHSNSITHDKIKNIFTVCKELRVFLHLKHVSFKDSEKVGDILNQLNGVFTETPFLVEEIRCLPAGRAKIISKEKFICQQSLPQRACNTIGEFTVDNRGHLYPCCVPDWPKLLCLGNVHNTPLTQLVHQARNNPFLGALRKKGPSYFVPFLEKSGYSFSSKQFVNECHLCQEILNLAQKELKAKEALDNALGEWKSERQKQLQAADIVLAMIEKNPQ